MSLRVLITGGNRGLGLEMVRQYLSAGDRVFATTRSPQPAGSELAQLQAAHPEQLTVVTLDVADEAALPGAVAAVRAHTPALDILVNNAGITRRGLTLGHYTGAALMEVLQTNAVAPFLVAQAFVDLLRAGQTPRVINISSQVGSFTWNQRGMSPLYAASKAALNMYTRSFASEATGIIAIAVHPGWVQTDMGGPSAPLTPPQSVQKLRELFARLAPADSGAFFNYDGNHHPY